MTLLENLRRRAAELNKHIVLPEGDDPRTLRAAAMCLDQGTARVTLLGDADLIRSRARELGLDPDRFPIIEPSNNPLRE
ncbi:MAG: phosphate acyltransferase, partial [Chloracidobacterium sp.]